MVDITATDQPIYFVIRSNDNSIVHHGEVPPGNTVSTGQPTVETTTNEVEYLIWINQWNDSIYIPDLPEVGTRVPQGQIYRWNDRLVQVRQTHDITHFAPDEVPALFTTVQASTDPDTVLGWIPNESVVLGQIRQWEGNQYRVIQSHVTQAGWEPPNVPALWALVAEPPGVGEWAPGVTYTTGEIVLYQGVEYVCLQGHTSIPGWEPPNVPALWQPR